MADERKLTVEQVNLRKIHSSGTFCLWFEEEIRLLVTFPGDRTAVGEVRNGQDNLDKDDPKLT